ncbi:MAG: magnesium transporter [Lachnospiraceae bacterium]
MSEERIIELLELHNYKLLKKELETIHPIDLAEILENLEYKKLITVYRLLGKEDATDTFTYMNSDMQELLINGLSDIEVKEVMDEMALDDTVDVLEEMPADIVDRVLEVTDEETRNQINIFLNYPEDSAGSIMTVEYIALSKEMTVAEAIRKIRCVGIDKETIYTCYVTDRRKLIGCVDVKDMLTSSDGKEIGEIMDENMIYAHTSDDQEDVAKSIKKYGLLAIPIVDHEQCMVGIVTVDDAMLVLQGETTEDISMMAAVSPSELSYFGTGVFRHARNRSMWLLILMLSSTITGMILTYYESALAAMPILVSFIPMLMGTSGNAGSQSATLIIRGLAVDEICFRDLFKVITKEFWISIIVGSFLAIANGIRVYVMYQDLYLAIAIGITLLGTIMLAKIIGSTLPLIAQKCHMDPALMAAPLITTLVDAGSILVYFAVVTRVFAI